MTFDQTNIELNLVVFKCHWFDPHSGERITPSIGLVEVRPSTTYSGADVVFVAHQAKQVYYLSYPCQKVELHGWEVAFQVSPHGNVPMPSIEDYNNIDPVTYEGIFYQGQETFGEFNLQMGGLEDLENDTQPRGEIVVDLKDIDMISKLHANNDIVHEPPPCDELPRYSRDSDSDNDNKTLIMRAMIRDEGLFMS
jgi:hypothetical protein